MTKETDDVLKKDDLEILILLLSLSKSERDKATKLLESDKLSELKELLLPLAVREAENDHKHAEIRDRILSEEHEKAKADLLKSEEEIDKQFDEYYENYFGGLDRQLAEEDAELNGRIDEMEEGLLKKGEELARRMQKDFEDKKIEKVRNKLK